VLQNPQEAEVLPGLLFNQVAVRSELRPQAEGLPEVEGEAGNLGSLVIDVGETTTIIAGAIPVGIQAIVTGVAANSRGITGGEVGLAISSAPLNQHRKG
jgi:hypothetical protein